jgi:hypothetical protein
LTEHGEFAGNDEHLSIDRGFHFEFSGNRCGSGYRTAFKPSMTGANARNAAPNSCQMLNSAPGVVQGFKTSSIIVANA